MRPGSAGYGLPMTLVLVALDESEASIAAARQARELFGEDASYLAVNVAESAPAWAAAPAAWGAVYPYPYAAPYPLIEEAVGAPDDEVIADARETAEELAGQAGIDDAAALGEIGDPADAILDAADTHHVDVIVVGSTHKNWWHRLIAGSVSTDLARRSTRPVLIAGQTADE